MKQTVNVMTKPFSQSCENNKSAILTVLRQAFSEVQQVFEVGSGTGQHAVYFAESLPHLSWQTSDLPENHAGINCWLDDSGLSNVRHPLALDLHLPWPVDTVDGIFTANTLHIVSWPLVEKFFEGVALHLRTGGTLCIYGPFNYNGRFTTQSNADFDRRLKSVDSERGIRDFETVTELAILAGLKLRADHTMPANNRLLEFVKT